MLVSDPARFVGLPRINVMSAPTRVKVLPGALSIYQLVWGQPVRLSPPRHMQ